MRVLNQDKTIELTEYDLNLGYLKNDTLFTHLEAVEGIEEQGHYETIAEYLNGGKDVKWVVDIAGVKAVEEHDETEDILVYIPYTESELTSNNLIGEKADIEAWLSDHDYIGIKIATGRATVEEYADEIEEMKKKADRINEIDRLLASDSVID